MPLLDYLKGGTITLSGDPNNVVTYSPNLYAANGSKGFTYNPIGAPEGGEGPLLGDRVTFSADANADPTFEYGDSYKNSNVIDNAVRGGVKFNLDRREVDVKRLSKFIYETDQGKQFIIKETALQLLNPQKPKIYNLGVNTLAQVAAAGASNIKRGGLLPNPGGELFPNQGNYFGGFKKDGLNREINYGLGGSAEKTDLLNSLIGISIDDITGLFGGGGKGYNVSLEDSELKLDKLNMTEVIPSDAFDSLPKDFIPFRFEVIDHKNPLNTNIIAFRAFLDSLGDDYSADFNDIKYNGRPETFYTYSGFNRKISVAFKIAAQTRHEMKPLYKKLNYLVAQTAPGYAGLRMTTPYIRLTIGDWISAVPGVINSVSLNWNQDYSWEIALDPNDKDKEMLRLPHVLDVTVDFTPIHNFVPSNRLNADGYIGINKWIKPSTPVNSENQSDPNEPTVPTPEEAAGIDPASEISVGSGAGAYGI